MSKVKSMASLTKNESPTDLDLDAIREQKLNGDLINMTMNDLSCSTKKANAELSTQS